MGWQLRTSAVRASEDDQNRRRLVRESEGRAEGEGEEDEEEEEEEVVGRRSFS